MYLRGAHLTARPRGRAARAEPLTVSFVHGSLTHRLFLAFVPEGTHLEACRANIVLSTLLT